MNSSLIGKVQKAREYATERDRMQIDHLQVRFRGDNSDHEVAIADGSWACNCDFFQDWHVCSHTMALERVLDGMVPKLALSATA
jgi:hypothetical protein